MSTKPIRRKTHNIHVGQSTSAIVLGEITDLSDWDDGELMRGRRRDKTGRFRGRPPKVVPVQCLRELNKRRFSRATDGLNASLVDAVEELHQIVLSEATEPETKLKAIELIFDRVLGKATQHMAIDMQATVDSPWLDMIAGAIVGTAEQAQAMLESGPPVLDVKPVEEE